MSVERLHRYDQTVTSKAVRPASHGTAAPQHQGNPVATRGTRAPSDRGVGQAKKAVVDEPLSSIRRVPHGVAVPFRQDRDLSRIERLTLLVRLKVFAKQEKSVGNLARGQRSYCRGRGPARDAGPPRKIDRAGRPKGAKVLIC